MHTPFDPRGMTFLFTFCRGSAATLLYCLAVVCVAMASDKTVTSDQKVGREMIEDLKHDH